MSQAWQLFERWFDGGFASRHSGLETTIQPNWSASPGWVGLILVIATISVWLIYWREPSAGRPWKLLLATIRTVLVALVLLLLYGWTMQRHQADLADVAIVLDDSASMGIADSYSDAAQAVQIRQRLSRLQLTNRRG